MLAVLVGGLIVVFLAGLTLDAITAPFDRDLGLGGSGSRGSAAAMIGLSAGGGGGGAIAAAAETADRRSFRALRAAMPSKR